MSLKKVRVLVTEDDKPVIPQLVPVTIRWVEADRAYNLTFLITLAMVVSAGGLSLTGMTPSTVLRALLATMVGHAIVRAYLRHDAKKKLDEMKQRLGI